MSSKFKAGDFPQFNEKIQYEMVEALNKKLKKQIKKYKNRSCENCKQWVGNAPFKGFCNVTGSSCCLGGCNDYFEPKG